METNTIEKENQDENKPVLCGQKNYLTNQVYILSVKTDDFFTDEEKGLNEKYQKLCLLKKKHNNKIRAIEKDLGRNKKINFENWASDFKRRTNEKNKQTKKQLQKLLKTFDGQRKLCHNSIFDENNEVKSSSTVSLFESTFTRAMELQTDQTTLDVVEVTSVWFEVMRQLIERGFVFNAHEYEYYASGAGQIRDKKAVFVRKDRLRRIWNKLTCGLTWDKINQHEEEKDGKKYVGVNPNKYNAYMALNNTASVKWDSFNVKRAIVVDDFETMVRGTVDYIDPNTYKIEENKVMDVPIPHMDGAGLITPNGKIGSHKCFQVRLPWIKGLLIPFDFKAFARDVAHVTTIKDIYGDTWNIDDVDVIFTKSQFKMHGYFEKWKVYQKNFIKYECEAAKFNIEEYQNPKRGIWLNYQYLQTLTDLSDDEIEAIGKRTFDDIVNIGKDEATMLKHLRADESNTHKNEFEEALSIYPELLKDNYTKKQIKDAKKKLVKNAKAGKLQVNGSYIFVLPDVVAFAKWLFSGDDYNKKVANNEVVPWGLLTENQVYSKLFDNGQELDLLRSPHLYREHAIRTNYISNDIHKWFIAKNAIYTSSHDLISKVLMFDVDGDKLNVVSDKAFVNAAKRNMKGVNPLYYEMYKATPQKLTKNSIADNLEIAYKVNINIGRYSNSITKILNNPKVIDWDVVKWLVAENNYTIDFAKTLTKMERKDNQIKKRIKAATKGKMPYFFRFAKDKEKRYRIKGKFVIKHEIPITEDKPTDHISTVNRLVDLIPTDNVKFSEIKGDFKVKYLMSVNLKDVNLNSDNSQNIINTYTLWDKKKHSEIEIKDNNGVHTHKNRKSQVYIKIRDKMIEADENQNANNVVNVLVKYLFTAKPIKHDKDGNVTKLGSSEYKKTLWAAFGKEILQNIRSHVKGTKQCEKCGKRFRYTNNRQRYCDDCRK